MPAKADSKVLRAMGSRLWEKLPKSVPLNLFHCLSAIGSADSPPLRVADDGPWRFLAAWGCHPTLADHCPGLLIYFSVSCRVFVDRHEGYGDFSQAFCNRNAD